jgi:hypothetical protein
VEIGQANPTVVNCIEMGRFEDWIPMGGQVGIALVVGNDDNNVGRFGTCNSRKSETGGESKN